MNAVIYARCSSSSQREASIEEQIKICTDYAQTNKYMIVEVYQDNALMEENDSHSALQKLLDDSSKNRFEAVIVYSIDRFGCNVFQHWLNQNKLIENNVSFFSATETILNNPSGRFFRSIMMAYAQFFSDKLDMNRSGHSLSQSLVNQNKSKDNNISLVSATETFPNDLSGQFCRNLMMAYAQFFIEELDKNNERSRK